MDIVHRYTFKLNDSTSASTINIPINLEAYPIDQSELIETTFVDIEMTKSINPIIDYEMVRFSPVDFNNNELITIIYKIILNNGGNYDNAWFENDDFYYRRNVLKKSFLKLDFYDSPILTSQNYLFSSTLYCRVLNDMYTTANKLKDVSIIPLEFKLDDPISIPSGVTEGYYIYDYKEDISYNTPKEIYMKCSFNNAKDGKTYNLMISNTPQTIDNLVNKLHIKYTLKIDINGKYYYQLDDVNNIILDNDSATINLYEIKVL
jgi:hypothetical protein